MNNDMDQNNIEIFNSTQPGMPPGMPQPTNFGMNFNTDQSNQYSNFNFDNQPKRKSNIPFIFISIVVLIIVIIILINRYTSNGHHQNNTGYGYSGSDVSFNCIKTGTDSQYEYTTYTDLVFNKQDAGLIQYTKTTFTSDSIIKDDKWIELALKYDMCSSLEDTKSCLKTELYRISNNDGNDARLIKSGNMITYSFWKKSNIGQKISKYDQKQFVKSGMSGYTCK